MPIMYGVPVSGHPMITTPEAKNPSEEVVEQQSEVLNKEPISEKTPLMFALEQYNALSEKYDKTIDENEKVRISGLLDSLEIQIELLKRNAQKQEEITPKYLELQDVFKKFEARAKIKKKKPRIRKKVDKDLVALNKFFK